MHGQWRKSMESWPLETWYHFTNWKDTWDTGVACENHETQVYPVKIYQWPSSLLWNLGSTHVASFGVIASANITTEEDDKSKYYPIFSRLNFVLFLWGIWWESNFRAEFGGPLLTLPGLVVGIVPPSLSTELSEEWFVQGVESAAEIGCAAVTEMLEVVDCSVGVVESASAVADACPLSHVYFGNFRGGNPRADLRLFSASIRCGNNRLLELVNLDRYEHVFKTLLSTRTLSYKKRAIHQIGQNDRNAFQLRTCHCHYTPNTFSGEKIFSWIWAVS